MRCVRRERVQQLSAKGHAISLFGIGILNDKGTSEKRHNWVTSTSAAPAPASTTPMQPKCKKGVPARHLDGPARLVDAAYACAVALANSSKLTSLSLTRALPSTKSTTLLSTTYASISARRC